MKFVRNQWDKKFWDRVENSNIGGPSSIIVWMEYYTYLIFNTDIVTSVWKTDVGEAESIALLIFVFWRCLNRWWMRNCGGWGRKSLLGVAKIASFSSRNFSWSNKHDTFWRVVTTRYIYVLFLWTIAVSDFCLLQFFFLYNNIKIRRKKTINSTD